MNTLITILAVCFVSACTQNQGFVCNIKGLTTAERAELPKLLDQLIAKHPEVRELSDGFELKFATGKPLFPVASKWISYENRCCPFFDLSISVARNDGPMIVRITGPEGVKAFIADDLPRIHRLTTEPKH